MIIPEMTQCKAKNDQLLAMLRDHIEGQSEEAWIALHRILRVMMA